MASDLLIRTVFVGGIALIVIGFTYIGDAMNEAPPSPEGASPPQPGDPPDGPPAGVPRVYKLGADGSATGLPERPEGAAGPAPKEGTMGALAARGDQPSRAAADAGRVEAEEEVVDIDDLPDDPYASWKVAGVVALGLVTAAGLFQYARQNREGSRAERTRTLVPGLGGVGDKPLDEVVAGDLVDAGQLKEKDPAFSRHALTHWVHDVVCLVQLAPTDPALPFLAEAAARSAVAELLQGVVSDVVVDGIRLKARGDATHQFLEATVTGYRVFEGDASAVSWFREWWTFRRPSTARSLPPELLVARACPECRGASAQVDSQGRCTVCGADLAGGKSTWKLLGVKAASSPDRHDLPTNDQRALAVSLPLRGVGEAQHQLAQLSSFVHGFSADSWAKQAHTLFQIVMDGWRDGEWRLVRPWCSDLGLDHVRAMHEPHHRAGRLHVIQGVRIQRSEIVRVEVDPLFAVITLRVWYRLREYIAERDETVAVGDPDKAVEMAACWTFLRQVGRIDNYPPLDSCPVCGASVDHVSIAGVCAQCNTRVTDGSVRWVLTAIEAVEEWHGR